jgi:hypothetical protein
MALDERLLARRMGQLPDSEAERLHGELGRLSTWWLADPVLDRLRAIIGHEPGRNRSLLDGEFAVLFARIDGPEWLQPAFALPLRWADGHAADDPKLPAHLRALADRIRRAVLRSPTAALPTLHLGAGCPDLSRLDMPADSAGAVLYASLHCAMHRVAPCPTRTASAALGTLGLDSIAGIEAKTHAAARIGIAEIAIAPRQGFDAMRCAKDVRLIPVAGASGEAQLAYVASLLDAPPTRGSFEERRDWYNRTPGRGSVEKLDFYSSALVRDLADAIRKAGPVPELDTLILCAGRVVEPMLLAAESLRARRVILLHDDAGEASAAERSRPHFSRLTCRPQVELLPTGIGVGPERLDELLRERVRPDERLGIDITPGPKHIAIYLERFARAWNGTHPCRCSYITSDTRHGVAIYGERDRLVFLA